MGTSFISEHSAEFVLIPHLIGILSRAYSNITPFYFWASREGSTVSRNCDSGERIRLIAAYPRRPKIDHPNQSEILIKFNAVLFERAEKYRRYGIPTLAGVPRISSVMELRLGAPCSWFELIGYEAQPIDIEGRLSLQNEEWASSTNTFVRGPLLKEQIIELVEQRSSLMLWQEAIQYIREARQTGYSGFFNDFFGGYKPFYLMLR